MVNKKQYFCGNQFLGWKRNANGLAVLLLACATAGHAAPQGKAQSKAHEANHGWTAYGGQDAEDHYSPLSQINRENVKDLAVAWKFDSGEKGGMQTNPLIIGHVLYAFTPSQKVIALDAATGKLLWKFDSGIDSRQPGRGLTYWTDGKQSRLFAGIMSFLYALDPATGKVIPSFGESGRIDLRKDLRGDYKLQSIALTSPGIIYKDLIITGGRNPELPPAPPGDIRAYDVHTGALRWTFHTIPHPGEKGYNTWPPNAWKNAGAANCWGGMALDAKRGIVYVPTGSAVPDFYGAKRVGNDLFADSLLALNAETGKLIWYFQGVHHDLWDRDFPAAPALVTIKRDGKKVDALAQTTKQGWLFVLDRETGKPLFPVEERPVPRSTVPGEVSSPTQPFPLAPAPYTREHLAEDMLTNRTPEAHAWAVKQFRTFRNDGPFGPLGLDKPTVVFPGFDGGAEWGGPAVDPTTGVLYVNANDIASTGTMIKNNPSGGLGKQTYQSQCAVCHGINRAGSSEFPSLAGVTKRLTEQQITSTIQEGRGRMPPFPDVKDSVLKALLEYLATAPPATNQNKHTAAAEEVGEDASFAVTEKTKPTAANTAAQSAAGAQLYSANCAMCHGASRRGNPPTFPSLINVSQRMTAQQISSRIRQGKGVMPPFPQLTNRQITDLVRFLSVSTPNSPKRRGPSLRVTSPSSPDWMAYLFTGYKKFYDPDGYPAVAPPWGTLSAIDLNTGKYLWKLPLGNYPELAAKGGPDTGTENYGGPIVTAGGLVFIGATVFDSTFRAFNSTTGELLWKAKLPFSAIATPATYKVNGKQYVVVASGGGKFHESPAGKVPTGGMYVAFALPDR
jgi:glucose dehydrogenase